MLHCFQTYYQLLLISVELRTVFIFFCHEGSFSDFFLFSGIFSYTQYFLSNTIEKPSFSVRSETLEQVCQKILQITSSANESKIIIDNSIGGLGHKSISIVEGILYSILSEKQLWCMDYAFLTL